MGQSGEDASETEHVVNDGRIRGDASCQGKFWAETGSENDQDMKQEPWFLLSSVDR